MGHKALCVYQLSGQHRCSEQPSTRRECSTSPTPLLSGGRPLRGTQTWSHRSHSATVRSTLFPLTWPTDSQRRAWEISLRAKEPPRIWSNQPGTEPRPSTLDPRPSQARRLERGPRWLAAAQTTDERVRKAPVGSTWSFDCHLPHKPQSAPLRQPQPRPIAVTAAQRRSQHVTPTSPIHTRAAAREELFRGGGREARTRRKEVEKRWAVFSASDFTSPPRRY